jgi:Uma2 family endonuclease
MSRKGKADTAAGDDRFKRRLNATPENKLELIDGRLVICDLAGSRRVAWQLLEDYGPPLGLGHAPARLWWQALQEAYRPSPRPATPAEWWRWAERVEHDPTPPPAGPQVTAEHRRTWDVLHWGLYAFLGQSGLGEAFGRDFVVRLGEDALTPDLVVIDRDRLGRLTEYYFQGPPTVAVEVTQPNTAAFDREVKFRLHEKAGTPEYWLFDPFAREAEFWRLENGRYRRAAPEADGAFRSAALPGLALSVPEVWTLEARPGSGDGRPFLAPARSLPPLVGARGLPEELGWDSVPFAPRVALGPQPIRFEEYISWCGRAKFERYGKGLVIGGSEATRRVFGMLLMTLGLDEVVRLAHPRDWVTFLAPEVHPGVGERVAALLKRAAFASHEGFGDRPYWSGEVEGVDWVTSYGESEEECRRALAANVREWVLLRLARGEGDG